MEVRSLCHLHDPMMGKDDHYLSFDEVFSVNTSEKDHPSLSHAKKIYIHTLKQTCTECGPNGTV